MMAEYRMAVGVFRFRRQLKVAAVTAYVVRLRAGTSEVKHSIALLAVDRDLELQTRTVVQEVDSFERLATKLGVDLTQQIAYSLLGSVHDRTHVELYRVQRLFVDELVDKNHSAVACRDLGVQVGDVLMLAQTEHSSSHRQEYAWGCSRGTCPER